MKKKVYEFLPLGNDVGAEANKMLYDIKVVKKVLGDDRDLSKLEDKAMKLISERNKEFNKIIKTIGKFYGKYIHIDVYNNMNYKDDRNEDPKWELYQQLNALPYKYVSANRHLFCIQNNTYGNACDYNGGIQDKGIDMDYYISNFKIVFYEITKEEFIETAYKTVDDCLNRRIEKINSDDYQLTEDGYERKERYLGVWADPMGQYKGFWCKDEE